MLDKWFKIRSNKKALQLYDAATAAAEAKDTSSWARKTLDDAAAEILRSLPDRK